MGWAKNGKHYWGVRSPKRTRMGEDQVMVVEATSWAQYADGDGGQHLALSDSQGNIVERFGPGEWESVSETVPGVDEETTG